MADVDQVVGVGGRGRQGAEKAALGVENADGGLVEEQGVELGGGGVVGEGTQADVAVEGDAGETFSGEIVGADVGEIAALEDEETIVFLVVGEAAGVAGFVRGLRGAAARAGDVF